jgi:hypothetical protein
MRKQHCAVAFTLDCKIAFLENDALAMIASMEFVHKIISIPFASVGHVV